MTIDSLLSIIHVLMLQFFPSGSVHADIWRWTLSLNSDLQTNKYELAYVM